MNNENNINGIPNVNDIKIEDTPAESFANIYGNGAQPMPAQPVQPAPQVAQPMPAQPVQPTPQVAQPMPAQPVQPAPQVAQPMPAQPVQPAPQVAQPMPAQPVQPIPQVAQPMPAQPVQPTQSVQPAPVQIDADRLQSIEEQLSKTSQYKPEDFQQEKIEIPTSSEYEENKSGLSFVIVLSIILGLAIAVSPFISKFFG